ncbi:predicted protein [Aspergillus terreus NIH2624]|uniref:Uncharacterized protein n=1 Tax=Aspergillus terreus (strain NIH 2624 / FGSC A1156) TaxID=341663 RepID=Q0D173_ASPTN|nr:uncharacterized protein ATEG_00311 [Aspergillus terreus NIH2624]EAU38957.1 predicted protein [Aspergillus terreus NIH2624]
MSTLDGRRRSRTSDGRRKTFDSRRGLWLRLLLSLPAPGRGEEAGERPVGLVVVVVVVVVEALRGQSVLGRVGWWKVVWRERRMALFAMDGRWTDGGRDRVR